MNDYNKLADVYRKTAEKPDKKYSILPTVMSLLGKIEGKRVLDLGCGSGFFTLPIARRNPEIVYAIDNSAEQLKLLSRHKRITPLQLDIFKDALPESDVINAPYVLNYAQSVGELSELIKRCYGSLSNKGRIVAVVDSPLPKKTKKVEEKQKRWGALKRFIGNPLQEASEIEIELFNSGENICKLRAYHYRDRLLNHLFTNAGFSNIGWHSPQISREGLDRFGEKFWANYKRDCELGYLTGEKQGKLI